MVPPLLCHIRSPSLELSMWLTTPPVLGTVLGQELPLGYGRLTASRVPWATERLLPDPKHFSGALWRMSQTAKTQTLSYYHQHWPQRRNPFSFFWSLLQTHCLQSPLWACSQHGRLLSQSAVTTILLLILFPAIAFPLVTYTSPPSFPGLQEIDKYHL